MAIRVMSCRPAWLDSQGASWPGPSPQILPDGDPESRLRDTRSHHLVRFRPPRARTLGKGAPDVCAHSVAERVRRSFTCDPHSQSPKKSPFRPLFGSFYLHPAHGSSLRVSRGSCGMPSLIAEEATQFLAPGKRGWSVSSRHLSSPICHRAFVICHP